MVHRLKLEQQSAAVDSEDHSRTSVVQNASNRQSNSSLNTLVSCQ